VWGVDVTFHYTGASILIPGGRSFFFLFCHSLLLFPLNPSIERSLLRCGHTSGPDRPSEGLVFLTTVRTASVSAPLGPVYSCGLSERGPGELRPQIHFYTVWALKNVSRGNILSRLYVCNKNGCYEIFFLYSVAVGLFHKCCSIISTHLNPALFFRHFRVRCPMKYVDDVRNKLVFSTLFTTSHRLW